MVVLDLSRLVIVGTDRPDRAVGLRAADRVCVDLGILDILRPRGFILVDLDPLDRFEAVGRVSRAVVEPEGVFGGDLRGTAC